MTISFGGCEIVSSLICPTCYYSSVHFDVLPCLWLDAAASVVLYF